jgi:hypothetical protein
MVSKEFIDEQSDRLYEYFMAKNTLLGYPHWPSVEKIKIIVKELCEIAEVEGNAMDAGIQVFVSPETEGLVVRPKVIIKKKKNSEEEDD